MLLMIFLKTTDQEIERTEVSEEQNSEVKVILV